jgi:hypothetical protein
MKQTLLVLGGLVVVLTFAFALAEGSHPFPEQKYETQHPVYNVQTNVGPRNISEKTLVGGNNATNRIWLTVPTNFSTPFGNFTFPADTELDCDVPPGYPNPCNPYGG